MAGENIVSTMNRLPFYVLLLLLLFPGCSGQRTAQTLDDIQSYLQERPDSALTALRSVPAEDLRTSRQRARYSLLHAMALHKSYIDTADLSVIEPAVRYYSRHGSDWEKMKTLHQLGIIQMNGGDYQSAVISLTDAAKYIDRTEDWFNGGLICTSLSQLYNKLHDNNEELAYAIRAEELYSKADKPVYSQDARIKQAIALSNLGRYQEAIDIYHNLLATDNLDRENRLSAMRHLAYTQTVRKRNNPREADSLFTIVLKETGTLPENCWDVYAYASILAGNQKRAERIFAQLDTTDRKYFDMYSRFLYEKGEYKNAYNHLVLSIASQTELLNVALTQVAHKAQRDHAELLRVETEHRIRLQRTLYLLGSLFLLSSGLIVILIVRRRYRKSREDNLRLMETAEMLSRQLSAAQTEGESRIAEIRQSYIKMYQSSFREIGELYESLILAGRNAHPQQAVWARVKKLTEEIAGDNKGSAWLEQMIDGAMDGLMLQFRRDYPNLRERDYKLMSFIVAGFDMSTLAIFFDKKSTSVPYTRKYRLKQVIEASTPEIRDRYLPFF